MLEFRSVIYGTHSLLYSVVFHLDTHIYIPKLGLRSALKILILLLKNCDHHAIVSDIFLWCNSC